MLKYYLDKIKMVLKYVKYENEYFRDLSSFDDVVQLFYKPRHASSLGITRMLFGFLMLIDVLFERSGLGIVSRWGNPQDCHFPLFPSLMRPPTLLIMGIIYCLMWMGALGITLGYKFKYSTGLFMVTYWYVLLLDKSYWNNHSYLFGIVAILFVGSSANYAYSVDSFLDKSNKSKNVPNWNYLILRFQFFLLYFLAGLKKIDVEWLGGHSMVHWGDHWVFEPFRLILTSEQVDYFVIHWFGFLLDLTMGFWLLSRISRPYAMVFSTAFHFMNSRLFSIGMFPYVCIATTPIFCDDDWPVKVKNYFIPSNSLQKTEGCVDDATIRSKTVQEPSWKQRFVASLLITHCGLQCFLPYSHFITKCEALILFDSCIPKGYNNWTNGLYGYSWDMMVHSWDSALVVVRVRDNISGRDYYLNPNAWTKNERWSKHADMCVQFAECLKTNLLNINATKKSSKKDLPLSNNISVYVDVWCSLNGRFQQRMFDPNYDLLKANWSSFKPVEWLLPLLAENSEFRSILKSVKEHVYSWSNFSDVLFVADFPGMHLENYLSTDLRNVSLGVLKGEVIFEEADDVRKQSMGIKLSQGENFLVHTGAFHKVHTVGVHPSLFMYTYFNQTKEHLETEGNLL